MRRAGVVSTVKDSVLSWQDPVARHQRSIRRARARLGRRVTAAAGLSAATAVLIPYSGLGLPDVGWAAAAAASIASAWMAGRRLRELQHHVPVPPMPRPASGARPAVERLARASRTLAALLAQLGPTAADIASINAEAAGASHALRELASRVDAMEAALAMAPADACAGLYEARSVLLGRLDEGAQAYERLVTTAAQCLAAAEGGPGDAFARRRLEEAADSLRGLAAGWSAVHAASRAITG